MPRVTDAGPESCKDRGKVWALRTCSTRLGDWAIGFSLDPNYDLVNREVTHVDRNPRTRPRQTWHQAWAQSNNHSLSTWSTRYYARETVRYGGWRSLAPALAAHAAIALALLAAAFGAAVLAAEASGTRSRALLVIASSVVLAQMINMLQSRRLGRRLIIAASIRAEDLPPGYAVARVEVRATEAADAKTALLAAPITHVEITYYRDSPFATVDAYFPSSAGHGVDLAAQALGTTWHVVRTIQLSP